MNCFFCNQNSKSNLYIRYCNGDNSKLLFGNNTLIEAEVDGSIPSVASIYMLTAIKTFYIRLKKQNACIINGPIV